MEVMLLAATPRDRLLKVLVPAPIVRAMDALIDESDAYLDRNEFVSDAVQGHIAELRMGEGASGARTPVSVSMFERESELEPTATWADGTLPEIHGDVPTLEPVIQTSPDPTWGMHNRDFPTLWAAALLGQGTQGAGRPVEFREWLSDIVACAWELPRILSGKNFDTAGFPTNEDKREASENRFVRFFVGEEAGSGPMFDLGIAAAQDGRAALTTAGINLLRQLRGFGCRVASPVKDEWADEFLTHLAEWAPADLMFLSEVLHCIDAGHSTRAGLVSVIADNHPSWTYAVVGTNVAGYVARAREWGLLARTQQGGEYVLESRSIERVQRVVADRSSMGEGAT